MVDALGRLIFNCGLLEGFSKNWIFELEEDQAIIISLCTLFWKQRTEKLKNLIEKKVGENDLQKDMIQVINDTQDLMGNFRNSVAHGIIKVKENDEVVVVDFKLRQNHETGEICRVREEDITLNEIREHIDQSEVLADRWVQLWERIKNREKIPNEKMSVKSILDQQNIDLAKIIYSLRQDLDIYELIAANVIGLQKLGQGKTYFLWAVNSAVNAIAIQICKIYEKEKKRGGEVIFELNSIDGVMRTLRDPSAEIIDEGPLHQFIDKYSNSPQSLDLKSALALTCEEFREKNKESIEKLQTHRNKRGAHSEQGFIPINLPSYDAFEQLFNFAHDFYQTILGSFLGGQGEDMNAIRQVRVALRFILDKHGLEEIKNELDS